LFTEAELENDYAIEESADYENADEYDYSDNQWHDTHQATNQEYSHNYYDSEYDAYAWYSNNGKF
jgi:hypothetical protein